MLYCGFGHILGIYIKLMNIVKTYSMLMVTRCGQLISGSLGLVKTSTSTSQYALNCAEDISDYQKRGKKEGKT